MILCNRFGIIYLLRSSWFTCFGSCLVILDRNTNNEMMKYLHLLVLISFIIVSVTQRSHSNKVKKRIFGIKPIAHLLVEHSRDCRETTLEDWVMLQILGQNWIPFPQKISSLTYIYIFCYYVFIIIFFS